MFISNFKCCISRCLSQQFPFPFFTYDAFSLHMIPVSLVVYTTDIRKGLSNLSRRTVLFPAFTWRLYHKIAPITVTIADTPTAIAIIWKVESLVCLTSVHDLYSRWRSWSITLMKASFDVFAPALFWATHWYLPSSALLTAVMTNWLWIVWLLIETWTILALELDCTALELSFLSHLIFGLGRPIVMQSKVTSEPTTVLRFLGSSTISMGWSSFKREQD